MLVMVVFFIAFRWIHLSTPLIRLFLLVLILLLMPTLNFLPVWFALSLLRFRLPSQLPMMFILWMVAMMVVIIPSRTVSLLTSFPVRRAIMFMFVSWFGLTLPLLNAAVWFRCIRLLKRLFVSSHLSEVIYVWCYCWRYCFCSCWCAMSKLFGGGQKAASGGIQGDVLATDNNTVGMGDAGIKSAIQGSNVPNPDEAVPSFVSGAMAKAGKGLLEGTLQAGTSAVSDKLLDLVGLGGKSAADKGKDTRDYLAAAFPELNGWDRAGADASSAGMVDAGCQTQKELTKMQLDKQKEIAEMQNETQKEIAGIQSATSRQNTKDQVDAQNEMLAYQQKESTARVASIMENTNLSKQQQVSEIMRQMLTQAQTAGQYFTNDQIKEMTRKVSAEVDLVHQQTQNQRYGSSHIGATAKDISNVVTDAASGVVDIFHGIDKAVADTWNNFWKDGKADGIGSNLSRK